ncbi:cysteine proteinase [Daldinia caldariorum]|uniref:cysteine proteinase n=1 Tax=Daldinia caldariorum TaxID=326644 RepID=UPI002008BDC9|nr:cysteine proteinase [Daldinia caldariorum]KAI1468364.1 cysteine proteinase [Daldinia caldariorum]
MASMDVLDDTAELRRLQSIARRDLQHLPDPQPLTSPRLFRQFLSSQLLEFDFDFHCTSHEMQLVATQSYRDNNICFVSIVCGRCRYHFHIRSNFHPVRPYNDEHRHHMLARCCKKPTESHKETPEIYDDTVGYARYICVADKCLFNVEISVLPSRIPLEDAAKFYDQDRVARNLISVKKNDPERYLDMNDTSNLNSAGILRRYLIDSLQHASEQPLKINKRNKKFSVCMGNDFDSLLKFLGFREGEDVEGGEPCWLIPTPEKEQNPTPVRTLRARVEDAQVELDILNGETTIPAWDKLLQVFQGDFPNGPVDANISSVTESDLALLGCLAMYPPQYFSWAAILLAGLRPRYRDEYLDAALRCIQNRSDDASTEIIMYRSRFDETSPVDIRVQEAFAFFNVSLQDNLTPDWFLTKYYDMAKYDGTDEFKAQAQQHLEAISSYLGTDIVSGIDPTASKATEEPGLMTSIPNGSGRRMSISSAAKFLGVELNWTVELIRDFVQQLVQDESTNKTQVVEAIDVLSELKRQQDKPEEAAELQQIAEFVKLTGYAPMLASQPHSSPIPGSCTSTPPGLKNIGNTCYLNSLLQYFYNVKVIRDIVLNFDLVKLDLDEEAVGQRRTGGNGTSVNLEEAIVARQFIEMLQGLFSDLQTTTEAAAQPSQKLANTALSSARDILDQRPQNMPPPPPLPARPSPAPPVLSKDNPNAANGAANDAVSITVESVNDKLEMASSRSSQTLVDEDVPMSYVQIDTPDDKAPVVIEAQEDVKMQDSIESWSLDDKIAEVSRQLERSDRSGTEQQDVGEIIGNILEHFMRAIRPDGPMPEKPDLQADKITETFFTTIVNYTVKTRKGHAAGDLASDQEENTLNVEIVPERWITAYPEEAIQAPAGANGTTGETNNARCTLLAALDRYFAYESIDGGDRARYSSIRSLPPILHICIQRSTPKGKNKNPVIIPEILCLDRYMEADKGSSVWLSRKKSWALKERLKDLEAKPLWDIPDGAGQSQQFAVSDDPNAWPKLNGDAGTEREFNDADMEDMTAMAASAVENATEDAHVQEAFFNDLGLKHRLSEPLEHKLSKRIATTESTTGYSFGDKFADLSWEATEPLGEMIKEELADLRQKEETIFDGMEKEKYNIHAVICHRGGTSAGHYWVWIRDFKRNVWYRYNDETVTEDNRGTEAVLNDLNETGDPYYVAYVRDEIKDELVDVPQRRKPEANNSGGQSASQDFEMIEGVAFDPDNVFPAEEGQASH